jgi:hypothetical protein
MEERMKDVKDDFIKSLLEHDVDEPLPPEHEQKIREGLGALLHAPAPSQPKPDGDGDGGALTDAAVKGGKLASYAAAFAALVVGAGVGFAIGRGTAPSQPTVVAPSMTTSSTPVPPAVASTNVVSDSRSSMPSTTAATTSTAPTSTVAVRTAPSTPPSGDAFDRERSLLDRARAALVRHDPAAAAQALDESERDFPKSQHVEERDYLRIQIARERGEAERVHALAKTFLTKYPQSLYRARVEPLAH